MQKFRVIRRPNGTYDITHNEHVELLPDFEVVIAEGVQGGLAGALAEVAQFCSESLTVEMTIEVVVEAQ